MTTRIPLKDLWRVRPRSDVVELLTRTQRDKLDKVSHFATYSPGSIITSQGSTGSTVAIVYNGWVKGSTHTPRGTSALNVLYGLGDLLGTEAFTGSTHTETTMPLHTTRLLVINARDFQNILAETPRLIWSVHQLEVNRRIIAERRRAAMTSSTGRERLALTLISLRYVFTQSTADNGPVIIPLTQDELSELAGTHRNTTVEALKTFRSVGALGTGRGQIIILDAQLLLPYTTHTADEPLI
ncbi:Crp/Fnr family transcriptional regulator [Saccharopolyspora endophytica]|uniref:Crp/Fnr family transcriptional regulator n=1 Tax=Saccharopolyspora endophytica TaxID=543886 RepID=A0ABS5D9V7_9PSEU|nr:Crp/Fnr family transcriptional regulator [Saccharopolyspora endophytica]MBQ0923040.1 Crp/Fnr family transcriptional regulator [Saccharopolyspora endophytica]